MSKRKSVEHPRELSDEDKQVVMKRRQERELDDYRKGRLKDAPVAGRANSRVQEPTKAERRLLGRQLDYEHNGLSTKGGYRRPGSLQR